MTDKTYTIVVEFKEEEQRGDVTASGVIDIKFTSSDFIVVTCDDGYIFSFNANTVRYINHQPEWISETTEIIE